MLGCKLDFLIRGEKEFMETQNIFGAYIIKGQLVYMPCFMTHDAMSLHVTQLKNTKHVDWYFYLNESSNGETNREGVAQKFTGTKINWTYKQQTFTDDEDENLSQCKRLRSTGYPASVECQKIQKNSYPSTFRFETEKVEEKEDEEEEESSDCINRICLTNVSDSRHSWVNLLNASKRFNDRYITKDEYIYLFKKILKIEQGTANSMNSWKNKKILSGVTVVREFIKAHEKAVRNKCISGNSKLVQGFESGSLYSVLSKKNVVSQSFNVSTSKIYSRSQYYIPLNEGKCTSLPFLLPYVTRQTNEAVQNSKTAMHFSMDGLGLICPLNTKDFKETGERITLADGVIMTEETNEDEFYRFLKSSDKPSYAQSEITNFNVSINGILTDLHVEDSLASLVNIKNFFPHVTTKYFDGHILFSTRECIPVKFFTEYDNFFSSAEIEHFNLTSKIADGDYISTAIKELSRFGLVTNKPYKITTSNTTLFHSISNKPPSLVLALMENSLGLTVYLDLSEKEKTRITEQTVRCGAQSIVLGWNDVYELLDKTYALSEQVHLISGSLLSYDKSAALAKLTGCLYNNDDQLLYHFKTKDIAKNIPFKCSFDSSSEMVHLMNRYTKCTFDANYKPQSVWNLKLWCAFGNPNGFCGLDGLVLDAGTAAALSDAIVYKACFTVDFMFENIAKAKSAEVKLVKNSYLTQSNLICIILSEYEACTKNSNHCEIKWGKYGNMYQYEINFLPKKMYSSITVDYVKQGKVLTLTIKGVRRTGVGIGTKFGNSFGQKNIVSQVLDLSLSRYNTVCYTRTGKAVYPQLIYSDVSVLGRQASGQVKAMLLSKDLAVNPTTGFFTAPLDVCIHNLHTFPNERIFTIKLNTLTGLNGFSANGLHCTSHSLRLDRKVYPKVKQVIGFHGYNLNLL